MSLGKFSWIILALALHGCAATNSVVGENPMPIGKGESVGVIQSGYFTKFDHEAPEVQVFFKNDETTWAEKCLIKAIKSKNPDISVYGGEKLLKELFPGKKREELPKKAEDIAAEFRKNPPAPDADKMRYLVMLDVRTSESKAAGKFDLDGDSGGGSGLFWGTAVRECRRYTQIDAKVLDLRKTGEMEICSTSSGKKGAGCAFGGCGVEKCFGLVCAFPIFYSSLTESSSCEALGNKIGELLLLSENVDMPDPAKEL